MMVVSRHMELLSNFSKYFIHISRGKGYKQGAFEFLAKGFEKFAKPPINP